MEPERNLAAHLFVSAVFISRTFITSDDKIICFELNIYIGCSQREFHLFKASLPLNVATKAEKEGGEGLHRAVAHLQRISKHLMFIRQQMNLLNKFWNFLCCRVL